MQGLSQPPNDPLKAALLSRSNFGRSGRTSKSYDDLEDHYAALNVSSSGYAKIRPRKRPSQSQDMWAIKMEDSIVSPKYLFDHPVYASHSQLDSGSRKKNKNYRIAPNTLNTRFVSPYSKVPVKISDTQTNTNNFNFNPSQDFFSFGQAVSSAEPQAARGSRVFSPEEMEDDTYSNDDYVDMASDTPEEDEQSLTGHYKHYSDFAPQHSTFGTG